jgi:indole-3-glycerol phosphate synthase
MSLTILDKIKAYKLQEVAADKALKPLTEIESEAREASPPRGFATALIQAASAGYGLIAEVKKASPSKGLIRAQSSRLGNLIGVIHEIFAQYRQVGRRSR